MSLTMSYLNGTKNLESILNSIISARAPERFTNKFLEDLGFKSSNDRLIVGMLKALGLIDETGVPTQRYYVFLDQSQSRKIISSGIQEAYEDLFNLRKDAQNMTNDEVKNKLKTLTQGQKGDRVVSLMATTFRAFCDYADWSDAILPVGQNIEAKADTSDAEAAGYSSSTMPEPDVVPRGKNMDLCYNIQIHLPETSNMSVYDAIFQSLKKHLL